MTSQSLSAEIQRSLARAAIVAEHVIVNAVAGCEWSPSARGCVLCRWHDLGWVMPL